MARGTGRWLRDVDVGLLTEGGGPANVVAPAPGGVVYFDCFTETYRAVLRRLVRTSTTVKVFVRLQPTIRRPQTYPEAPFEGSDVSIVDWPIDADRLRNCTIEHWVRIHFEEMHAGIVHLARERGWALEAFELARRTVVESGFRYQRHGQRRFLSPNRRFRIRLDVEMDWRWLTLFAVLTTLRGAEVGRREIHKLPATLSSLPDYSTPLSKWQSPTRFVFRCKRSGWPASPLSISTSWRDEMCESLVRLADPAAG